MAKRVNFGQLTEVLEIPDLIGVQLDSYADFLQMGPAGVRKVQGLQEVFEEVFPIESFDKQIIIRYKTYEIGEPKSNVVDCLKDGMTYGAGLYVDFELENRNNDEVIPERVYFGEIPIMTESGTFIINGAERVIISQLHRSPGICFEKSKHTSGKTLYSYRIIPDRGSWMEVQFDINDLIYIYLDRRRRRRKFLITTFLRAVGYDTNEEILSSAYEVSEHSISSLLKVADLDSYYLVDNIENEDGIVLFDELSVLSESLLKQMQDAKVKRIKVCHCPDGNNYLINCLERDPARSREDALKEIYKRMRPGDPPSVKNAELLIERLFFDVKRYDLGMVGRHKINEKLDLDFPLDVRVLVKEDLMGATKYMMNLRNTGGATDDIDHLGARRVRTVGELLQNHCRVGLLRTERLIREKMTLLNADETSITPYKLINPKAFVGVVRDFFARNQLSQFMDQTNPLSELTNKRRLSALGPGGLSRERAGFEVRDVHTSHYGRICPIETPEGPNIGLISSMSLYSQINEYGFLETPYRKVVDGIVTDEIEYLSGDLEEQYVIAQANAKLDKEGRFVNEMIMSRYQGESEEHPADEVNYMDVSPKQLVSAAAGIIPFLEHDDANRALMGSNMQRQAVPLLTTESPLVGTGLEGKIAVDSRSVVTTKIPGIIAEASANEIVVTCDGLPIAETSNPEKAASYKLKKFMRSNAGTCINQSPVVFKGQEVAAGDVIADGAATEGGELALGKNVCVAFMPWCGYNFEDAIVISEKIVKEDVYTSIHVDEFEITARETKLGSEEITRDIPNLSEDALRNLDANGIIRLGAEVAPGDILVGKITPKSETELAPEERLLRAIFGEKAADVKDSSLVVPSGKGGIVMDIRTEYLRDPNKGIMTKAELRKQIKSIKDNYKGKHSELSEELCDRLADILLGQKLPHHIYDGSASKEDTILISSNRKVTRSALAKLANKYDAWVMDDCHIKETISKIIESFVPRFKEIALVLEEALEKLENGDPLETGEIKRVKVFIASKRKLQVGDKMAGRHGNKGIVANIVSEEDMPFMPDGRPVDIVLNPLGVPSRMNIGQVLETHLGWAAKILGINIATPVFDGIPEEKIVELMKEANQKLVDAGEGDYKWGFTTDEEGNEYYDGKTDLYDGRTGNRFDQRVMVGMIYMLKLDHLVANKIHARAVGPYSLVTQQPLGGKAQHGGQRFGEMEVWALEAYGAAYTLQEMLTVKSDDVMGRARIYESIVKGQNILESGRPESFNVLVKEMQALGLDIRTVRKLNA
ncbi:DNA-directed RNA polymerase subunit beta [Lentisphaerae bacterium WC36]|nr:DNA-directed RNA polymerase subunit beta [Lentisphaerae bacterium WC36]